MVDFLVMLEPCENPDFLSGILFARYIIQVIFIVIPIALIVMLSVDLVKCVMANLDNQKAYFKLFTKRLIYCVMLFFVPTIVNLTLEIVSDNVVDVSTEYNNCIANLDDIEYFQQRADELEAAEQQELSQAIEQSNNQLKQQLAEESKNSSSSPSSSSSSTSSSGVKKVDKSKTFHQSDWGTVGGVSMTGSGCGPTALASIIYAKDNSITPTKVATWLKDNGYFSSDGTTRSGINQALSHYKFSNIETFYDEHKGLKDETVFVKFRDRINKGEDAYIIFLAIGEGSGGKSDFWPYSTYGGHFLAITNYRKTSNGYEYFVRDPGVKKHTDWYDISKFKGNVNVYWIANA